MNRHQFALYIEGLSNLLEGLSVTDSIRIKNQTLFHRVGHVLRLDVGDTLILFDSEIHVEATITQLQGKQAIEFMLLSYRQNKVFSPGITVGLPLLRREGLEDAVYGLVEVGATTIQFLVTQKSQRWHGQKELDRLQRILIAAAEQSKHFKLPQLCKPIWLQDFLSLQKDLKHNQVIFFDPSGESASVVISRIGSTIKQLTLLVGPEGDLSKQEKKLIADASIPFCALTPTVLRAQQAAVVAASLIRTML